jgi:pyruvate/2-oxoglutarate dehydrogenase complex dihydrolipoamide dehydrogenase (E3) component
MLETRGVTIQLNRKIQLELITANENGVRVPGPDVPIVEADLLLVATGRKPNSEGTRP